MAQRSNGRHWSDVESLSRAEVASLQNERLQGQMAYLAAHSAFYQEKFRQHGLDPARITSVGALESVPFTDKLELRDSLAAAPPLGHHLAADPSDVVQIQASSGTTGRPSYVGLTASDIKAWCEMGARTLYANGLRPGDRVLHAFGMSKGFVGGVPFVQILQYMGAVDIPIGAEAGAERLLRVQSDVRANALIGTPYFVQHLASQAPSIVGRSASELGVHTISVGGEPGGGLRPIREGIEAAWGATCREMLGGTDLGCTYWGECEAADGMHFQSPDLMIAELIDPVTGDVLAPDAGVEGELVYTALGREASPLLRFRSGDHVVVTGIDCACGRTGFKVRCIGRTDDMLIVRGINVFPSALKELIAEFVPETTGELRIRPDFEGHSTQRPLPVVIELARDLRPERRSTLSTRIVDRVRSALNIKVDVLLVEEGTLSKPDHAKVALIERRAP